MQRRGNKINRLKCRELVKNINLTNKKSLKVIASLHTKNEILNRMSDTEYLKNGLQLHII